MVAQLFTNTFFFLNGALFNTLIDQGVELDLFQNTMGVKVRELNVQHTSYGLFIVFVRFAIALTCWKDGQGERVSKT